MLPQSYIKKTNAKCFIGENFFVILHCFSIAAHIMIDEQQYFDLPMQEPVPYPPVEQYVPSEPAPRKYTPVLETREGIFEQAKDQGFGFLRTADHNFLASDDDTHIGLQDVKRYRIKTGDYVVCKADVGRPAKYAPCVEVISINGDTPEKLRQRVPFEKLVPVFPNEKFTLVNPGESAPASIRMIDLFAPIGRGQRGMIVAQPKTGKTTIIKDLANAIIKHNSDVHMVILLVDERPEEVTDIRRSVGGAMVVASTFDEKPKHHVDVATVCYEHARRMVESGKHVVILMDSLTRLARAYNILEPSSGKLLSGGVDPAALHGPKKFYGAARNIENGGSLTIIATALIETGSKMDDFIFEEFKGTGNMELQLSRLLANRRSFPAIDVINSSTRRDDLLLPANVLSRIWMVRKSFNGLSAVEASEIVLQKMDEFKNNEQLLDNIFK